MKGIKAGRQRPHHPVPFPVKVSVCAILAILAAGLGAVVDLNAVWSWLPCCPGTLSHLDGGA